MARTSAPRLRRPHGELPAAVREYPGTQNREPAAVDKMTATAAAQLCSAPAPACLSARPE